MEASDPEMIRAEFARVREGGAYAEKLAISQRDHHLMSEDQARSKRMDPFNHGWEMSTPGVEVQRWDEWRAMLGIPASVEDQIEKAWAERGQLRPVLGPVC